MTDINDLYEPGDDREPCEPEQEPPISSEELTALLRRVQRVGRSSMWTDVLLDRMPELVAELIAARERIAGFEALETREEWAVTKSCEVSPPPHAYRYPGGDAAVRDAKRHGRQAWRRALAVHSWEPIANEPPF